MTFIADNGKVILEYADIVGLTRDEIAKITTNDLKEAITCMLLHNMGTRVSDDLNCTYDEARTFSYLFEELSKRLKP